MKNSTIFAFVFSLICLAGIELLVRHSGEEYLTGWDYWGLSAANKYVTFFNLKKEKKLPKIIAVGDSSCDDGFHPTVFNEMIGCKNCSFNLCTQGNFPISFDKTVNSLILKDSIPGVQYVFVIFTRGGFVERDELRGTEISILSSPVIKKLERKQQIQDYLHMTRIWQAKSQIWEILKGNNPIDSLRGYSINKATQTEIKELKKFDDYKLSSERFAVLINTIKICLKKDLEPIVIHPPIHSFSNNDSGNYQEYTRATKDLCNRNDIPFWDFSRENYDSLMADYVHLTPEGAKRFTREIATKYKELISN